MKRENHFICRIFIIIAICWTIIIALAAWSAVSIEKAKTNALFYDTGHILFKSIVMTREWNSGHGGVYVLISPNAQPNEYLDISDRDITTTKGQKLTMINPAYMTRQISEIATETDDIKFHITSLNPIRPANAPDLWEKVVLENLSHENPDFCNWMTDQNGKRFYRYMAPLWVKESCLKCHAKQGYKLGQIRGGISVTLPADNILGAMEKEIISLLFTFGFIWLIGLGGIEWAHRAMHKKVKRQIELAFELQETKEQVSQLAKIIPICANCKKIRDDQGYWQQVEKFIRSNIDIDLSHGMCPDCLRELYPDDAEEILRDIEKEKENNKGE